MSNKISKFIKIPSLSAVFIFTLIFNLSFVFSQSNHKTGFETNHSPVSTVSINHSDVRIYQGPQNVIKFEVPDVNYAKISIYDSKSSLIRTYLFNNLREGTYEISTSSGNFRKGTYNCVLQVENIQESSVITIN